MPDVTAQLVNPQVVEIWVNGPDGANRLFLCSGQTGSGWGGFGGGSQQRETFTFFVGPQLSRRELVRASCAAGITGTYINANAPVSAGARIISSDADWDDESGQVQVTLQLESTGGMGMYGFHYHVMILAEQVEQ